MVLYGLFTYVSAIEPFSTFGAIGTAVLAGLYTVYGPIKCQFKECCTSTWINLNSTGIKHCVSSLDFWCWIYKWIKKVWHSKVNS